MENEKKKITQYKRKTVFTELGEWCYLSDDTDYIEVTDWANGDGFDVNVNSKNMDQMFHMTHGQFKAFKKIYKKLYVKTD